jgi:hypothetical protein
MPQKDDDQNWEEDLYKDYMPVAYGRDEDQATQLVDILNDHEIPAEVGETVEDLSGGIPVLVPADLLDEAKDVIEDYEGLEGLVLADDEYEDEDDDEDSEGFEELDEEDLFLGEGDGEEEEEEEDDDDEEEGEEGEEAGGDDDDDEFEFEEDQDK